MSKPANTGELKSFLKVRKYATRILDPKSIASLVGRHKMKPYVILETKYLRINSFFYTPIKAWLPILAFPFLPGLLLALCHHSGAAGWTGLLK